MHCCHWLWPTGRDRRVFRVSQQNLLPALGGHVEAATHFKGVGFLQKGVGGSLGFLRGHREANDGGGKRRCNSVPDCLKSGHRR